MEIETKKNEKDYLEIEIKGEDVGFAQALKELLFEDKDVEFAACRMDHPQAANPVLIIRTKKGSPMFALKNALKKLRKEAADFKDELKAAKKPKK
ncbi:DNA-directed RNA polymerase subunit L [uncultured archaeon]|nr:DNA-directed RNA polymerase subunit L [uncultured archaeon]